MTATIHRIEPRPASRQLIEWRIDMCDESLADGYRLHCADMATIFGDDVDAHDATAVRNVILAAQREADAPFAWVDEPPPRINGTAALVIAGAIGVVLGLAFAAWGETVATKAAANVLAAQDGGMW